MKYLLPAILSCNVPLPAIRQNISGTSHLYNTTNHNSETQVKLVTLTHCTLLS